MTELTSDGLKVASPRLFIVHASEDEWFVKGFLLPSLGLRKEEVLRSTKLDLGAPVVEEIARGAKSPLTVVVMSPSLFESPWGRFANQLATHQSMESVEDGSSVVVPAMLLECAAPLYSRFKVSLDFRAQERWEDEARRLRGKLAAPVPAPAVVRCPYPGMLAFKEKAAADFYGREAEVLQALTYVEAGTRELYVIGSSGSGKSSLVAAGLLPKLQRAAEHGGARYLARKMRPGANPLAALASALEVTAAEAAPVEWHGAVSEVLARHPGHERVLLFVDQLEELFTTAKAEAREAFVQALLQLRGEERVVTLLTLRADFYGELINSALWEGSGRVPMRLDVKPLRGASLRDAIEKPARGLGVYFEPVLVERLLQEVKHEAGALPLLQDALVQLWRDRTRGILRLADYEGKGTGEQTRLAARVQHRADAALHELTMGQQQLARRVLLRLVQFGEGDADVVTRRQQTRAALAAAGDVEDEVDAVIRHLADRRLVTTSEGDELEGWAARVDLAHEVLLTAWPTLKEWIQTRREDEQRRRVLEGKAAEWVRSGRGQTRLLDAEELAEVRGWLTQEAARELGPSEQALALVAASEAAEAEKAATLAELERQRRQAEDARAEAERQRERAQKEQEQERLTARRRLSRFVIVGLTVFSVVASVLGFMAWRQQREAVQQGQAAQQQRNEAQQQRKEAERLLGRNVLEHGRNLLLDQLQVTLAIPLLQQAIALGLEDYVMRTVLASVRRSVWKDAFFHGGSVVHAAFSSDGERVVTASWDKTARVWSVATGRPVGAALEHQGWVNSAAFSPDGTRVVTASRDRMARVWDAATGRPTGVALEHHGAVNSAVFSSDGTRIVTASDDGTARVWDAATGRPMGVALEHHGAVNSAVFSSDGTRIVTASDDGTARVWDAATGRPMGAALEHHEAVTRATFSPDGRRVVTASSDNTARVWDVMTCRPMGAALEHQGPVTNAAFSSDGKRVVTSSADNTARVWNAATGSPVAAALEHHGWINSVAFSPDGSWVITASRDKTAQVWDVATARPVGAALEHQDWVNSAAFSPDGSKVVTASFDNTAKVWGVTTGTFVGVSLEHSAAVESAAFSPDGARVVTTSRDGKARLWDATNGSLVGIARKYFGQAHKATFNPDGARVLTERFDHTVWAWDVATGLSMGATLEDHGSIKRAVFSPDLTRIVTASVDGATRVSNAATGRPVVEVEQGAAMHAAFSPDGRRLVTTSGDKMVWVWDVATGRPVGTSFAHQDRVLSVAFSPDSTRVVTVSTDKTARVWDVETGSPVGAPFTHRAWVRSAAFSPDGTRVVTVSDKTARVWDVAKGRPLSGPLAHQNRVNSAAFSPDGTRIVTASDDGTARVWDAATGRSVGTALGHPNAVNRAAFSLDGTRVVTTNIDGIVRVWDVATCQLVDYLAHQSWSNRSMAFSPDGARIVIASDEKTAEVWDVATMRQVGPPLRHPARINSAAFSSDGTRVVTMSTNQAVWILDITTGRLVGAALEYVDRSNGVAFSRDGKRVVVISDGKTAWVWDVATGRRIGAALQHQNVVTSAAFSPDGTRVATASGDKMVRVWVVATGSPVGVALEHQDVVTSVAFSPDGTRVVTASGDKRARVWDLATGSLVGVAFEHQDAVTSAEFSPDGTRVVTASKDKTARVWEVETGRPLGAALKHIGGVNSAEFSPDGTRVVTTSDDQTARLWDIAETGSLKIWSEQATSCVVNSTAGSPSMRCQLAQQENHFGDLPSRARALIAVGDQRMFSRVSTLTREAYGHALKLLDTPDGAGFAARSREALHGDIAWRLAMLDALEGEVPKARARLGAKAPAEDAAFLNLLAVAAHTELFNDEVALALLLRASELAPSDPSTLSHLAEVYFSSGQLPEVGRTVAKIDLTRAGPERRVVLAALAWAMACLTRAPQHAGALRLKRAYAALPETSRIEWSWEGTKHALTYGRYRVEESQPVLEVLRLLEEEVSDETRAKLNVSLSRRRSFGRPADPALTSPRTSR